jgi:hypothetical protein
MRFEILLTSQEAQRIRHEAARRGLPAATYARMALLGGVDHSGDLFERAISRIAQAVRRDMEAVVAAVAAAATIVIGQVANRRVPAEERSRAVDALIAYYRERVASGAQMGNKEGNAHVG